MGCLCCKQVEEERRPLLEGTTVNISYTTVVVYNDSVVSCLLPHEGSFLTSGFACESKLNQIISPSCMLSFLYHSLEFYDYS